MREEAKNEKITALFEAVAKLLSEGADIAQLKVSDITACAGIGKGTAYDYFNSKEELIIAAILYFSQRMVVKIISKMDELESFQEKFYFFLEEIEGSSKDRTCAMKCIAVLNQNHLLRRIEEKFDGKGRERKDNPLQLVYYLLETGKKEGVIGTKLPSSYQEIIMISKILSYMLYLDQKEKMLDCSSMQMKQYLYEGIIRELSV